MSPHNCKVCNKECDCMNDQNDCYNCWECEEQEQYCSCENKEYDMCHSETSRSIAICHHCTKEVKINES